MRKGHRLHELEAMFYKKLSEDGQDSLFSHNSSPDAKHSGLPETLQRQKDGETKKTSVHNGTFLCVTRKKQLL